MKAATGIFVFALIFALSVQGDQNSLVKEFNAFFTGDCWISDGDCAGRLAVLGNATIHNYSAGLGLFGGVENGCQAGNSTDNSTSSTNSTFDASQYSIVVGKTANISGVDVSNGGILYGDPDSTISNESVPGSCNITQGDVTSFFNESVLFDISANLSQLNTTSTYTVDNNLITLNFTGEGNEVFNISAEDLSNATSVTFSGTPMDNSSVLLNIDGDSGFESMTTSALQNFSNYLLWNFWNAQSVGIHHADVYGTILAPNATILAPSGNLYGQLWAQSYNSSDTPGLGIFNHPFLGDLF